MSLKHASIATALLLALAGKANAAIIVTTTGTLHGRDGIGLFAAEGTELNGLEYTFKFRFSRDLNSGQETRYDRDLSWGGWDSLAPMSGPIQMTLRAGGRTLSLRSPTDSSYYDIIDGQPSGNLDSVSFASNGWNGKYTSWLSTSITASTDWFGAYPRLGQKLSRTLTGNDVGRNGLWFYTHRPDVDTLNHYSELRGVISTISVHGEVPEPTSIALMAVGLVGVASIKRRNNMQES